MAPGFENFRKWHHMYWPLKTRVKNDRPTSDNLEGVPAETIPVMIGDCFFLTMQFGVTLTQLAIWHTFNWLEDS